MYRQKLFVTFGIIAALMLAAAGCASKEEELATTINVNLQTEPPTLDPCLATDTTSLMVIWELFLGLTNYDEGGEVIPRLATEWEVSEDGLVWTFTLRKDAYWVQYDPETKKVEKKRKVTAHDVEYAAKRTINPETGSGYGYVQFIIKNAEPVYTAESAEERPPLESIGVKALDDYTVQFTLEHAAGYFPCIAGMWVNFPLPREVIEQHGEEWTDSGNIWTCGPYVLDTWEHDVRIVLVKNPYYYDAGNVSIETVNLLMIAEASTAFLMYEAGELDTTRVPLEDRVRVLADTELSKQVHIEPMLATAYIGFTVALPPVNDVLVRKALAAAVDKQKMADTFFRDTGHRPAKAFAPPGIFGSPADSPDFEGIPFHPAQAREWLAEAGYADGKGLPEIGMMFSTTEAGRMIAEFLQKEWKEHLGIDVKFTSMEWKAYLARISTDPPQMWLLGWAADYLDENNWVLEVFHPTKGGAGRSWDLEDPAAKRFMEVTEAAQVEPDPERRKELYFEAEKILCEDEAIIIPAFHTNEVIITKPYVERTFGLGSYIHKWKVKAH